MQRFDAISIVILLMLSGCAALPDAEKPVPPVAPEKRITEFPKEIVPHEASIPHTRSTEEQQELNPQNKSKISAFNLWLPKTTYLLSSISGREKTKATPEFAGDVGKLHLREAGACLGGSRRTCRI